MVSLKIKNKGSLRKNYSKLYRLGTEIESHPAWKGSISLSHCSELLKDSDPFTFILSQGFDTHHYFLSFVDTDHMVKYRNVRVFLNDGDKMYKNGGSGGGFGGYNSIENLIPSCLNCSANICKPL